MRATDILISLRYIKWRVFAQLLSQFVLRENTLPRDPNSRPQTRLPAGLENSMLSLIFEYNKTLEDM